MRSIHGQWQAAYEAESPLKTEVQVSSSFWLILANLPDGTAGGVPGFSKGYVLYGKEGTLFLDLDAKKLFLTRKASGGQREELAISEDKKEGWKVRATQFRWYADYKLLLSALEALQ